MRQRKLTLLPIADKSGMELTLAGGPSIAVTSAEIEQLILALMAMRSQLLPALDDSEPGPGTQMMTHDSLRWAVGPGAEEGTSQLAMFHPGIGWSCVNLSSEETLEAGGRLAELAPFSGGRKPN